MPFLYEVVSSESLDRFEILVLLGLIAGGKSYAACHRPTDAAAVSEETGWVIRARRAVADGLDVNRLADEDCSLRRGAAFVAASVADLRPELVEDLHAALAKESDPQTRASLQIALASFGVAHGTGASRLFDESSAELVFQQVVDRAVRIWHVEHVPVALDILIDVVTNDMDVDHMLEWLQEAPSTL